MTAYEIILKKRNGQPLTQKEIHFFISEYLKHNITDYQMTAFLMAVWYKHLNDIERFYLTMEMMHSGYQFAFPEIPAPKSDKHSTGGVGDGVSLSLAPLVASCGVAVPMMSGRGLGHTGGTLDKLESIPGFNVFPDKKTIKKFLKKIGVVLFGQTSDIVPADKKMYALRDVTATVDSIDLIASSIMSKKLCEGTDSLVLDIKTGQGAFMQSKQDAEKLAKAMIKIGKYFKKDMTAFITDMNQPLGYSVGNSLEMIEHIEILKDHGSPDLTKLVTTLGGEMLKLSGVVKSLKEGTNKIQENIQNGKGLEKLEQIINAQSGDPRVLKDYNRFPKPKIKLEIKAKKSGYISNLNALTIGKAAILLGAGRLKANDKLDYAAGFKLLKKVGDKVKKSETLAFAYSSSTTKAESGANLFLDAVSLSKTQVKNKTNLILKKI